MKELLPPYHRPMNSDTRCHMANDYIAELEAENERLEVCGSCRCCAWDQSIGFTYCTAHQYVFVRMGDHCHTEWFAGTSRWAERGTP